jgi:hypothetical protein
LHTDPDEALLQRLTAQGEVRRRTYNLPRCSFKRMLASVTALSAGFGSIVWIFQYGLDLPNLYIPALILVASGPMIGAGILTPFGRPGVGVAVGLTISLTIFVCILCIFAGPRHGMM